MLQYGEQIRDEFVWKYPILPGAVYTYQQMAAGREWRISSSTASAAARAIEYLHNAVTYQADGLEVRGFEDFEKRRVMDFLSIGRTLFYAPENGPLEYLDPVYTYYNPNKSRWESTINNRVFPRQDVFVHHPIPVGSLGYFISPLAFIMPTAMLAWLIREHDKAAVDGRKIRDFIVVKSKELATQIGDSMKDMIALWSGADVSKVGVNIVYYDGQTGDNIAMSDVVTRIGVSEIPAGFDRQGFQFEYVNEIAAALGISLRHFWNSERATNRALEEVQEARQMQKGPSSYVRTEQRLISSSKILHRFNRRTRMSFVEEVDAQSQETHAKVLKMYSEALLAFAEVFGGKVNGDAFLGWLQGESILPADIELVTNIGVIKEADDTNASQSNDNTIQEGDPEASPLVSAERRDASKSLDPLEPDLDYGEITMDQNFHILERRNKVFSVEKAIVDEMLSDAEFVGRLTQPNIISFEAALREAREKSLLAFREKYPSADLVPEHASIQREQIKRLYAENLTDDDYRLIHLLVSNE